MNSLYKNLDKIQLLGFFLSATVSIGFIISGQDSLLSVTLGIVLATLTQLFDVQKRLADSEERLLQASALSKILYQDEWLLKNIQQMIEDYQLVKGTWFDLYRRRASGALAEARDTIHLLAEGHMVAYPRSLYTFGAAVKPSLKKTYKHVAAMDNISYWRSVYSKKALEENRLLVRRGVSVTRIFIQNTDICRDMLDVFIKQQEAGIQVYIAFAEETPSELYEDYVIADDVACAQMDTDFSGHYKKQRISIDPIVVENLTRNFNILIQHSQKLDDVISSLKQ